MKYYFTNIDRKHTSRTTTEDVPEEIRIQWNPGSPKTHGDSIEDSSSY